MEPSQDSKNIAALMWLGSIFLGIIAPLVVYFVKTDDEFLRTHSKEALNWAITLLVLSVIAWILVLVLVGFLILPILLLLNIVFSILGAIAASDGKIYNVPFCWRLIK
ncbi:MAG: DUF4870 domain-containing protein [Moraxellaceae bacterium]|jgi:uncharacterized protein|nr:MAG: DUF4870 domain-containing protein [Moraxellaceae bacterium]